MRKIYFSQELFDTCQDNDNVIIVVYDENSIGMLWKTNNKPSFECITSNRHGINPHSSGVPATTDLSKCYIAMEDDFKRLRLYFSEHYENFQVEALREMVENTKPPAPIDITGLSI